MRSIYILAKCFTFFVLIFACPTVCGQVLGLGTEQEEYSLNEQLALDTTFIDTLQVKQRIEEGIKKYGKENLKQVLREILYDHLKKIVEEQGPNPMDVLYDKMIQDLSEEAQGKENHAVEYYSKAFADSLMQKLYYNYNLGKREQKYKAFALNLISAAFCKSFNSKSPKYKITAYNDVLLFRNYDIYNQKAIRESHQHSSFSRKSLTEYYSYLDSLNYSSNQDVWTRGEWELHVESFARYALNKPPHVPMFSDIKRCIPKNSTLIEYCNTYVADKTYMCAYIIRNTSAAPEIVVLNVSDSLKASIINTQDSSLLYS